MNDVGLNQIDAVLILVEQGVGYATVEPGVLCAHLIDAVFTADIVVCPGALQTGVGIVRMQMGRVAR